MNPPATFDDVLTAVEQLSPDAQAELVSLLQRRLSDRGRERVVQSVAEARREFADGLCQVRTARELIDEARS